MKIDFSKVIFMDESQVTFDGPNGWAKRWILSNSDVPVAKRIQQGGNSVIWAGIVDQPITGPFNVDAVIKLNSVNSCIFIDKTFIAWYKSRSHNFKVVFM